MRRLSRTLTGVVAVATMAAASVATATIVDPVGYWDFEIDVRNQVTLGTALNAEVIGGDPEPAWSGGTVTRSDGTSTRPGGQVGNGVNLVDVDNDRLQLPFGTSNLGDSFAISSWYYLSPNSGNGSSRYFVFEGSNNYDVSYGISSGDTYASYVGQIHVGSTVTSRNAWHHVLHSFSSDGSNTTLDVYIDGALKHSGAAATSAVNFPAINLGLARSTAGDRDWDGVIDEVAVWDHALTSAEAQQVYQRGLTGQALEFTPDPVGIDLGGTQTHFSMDMESPIPSEVQLTGWATDTFTPGSGADLGDGGFSATTYLRTQGSGDNSVFLSFFNLPEHEKVDVGMIIAQLDSLDPARDGDRLTIKVDGQELLSVGLGYGDSTDGPPPSYSDAVIHDLRINGTSASESVLEAVRTLTYEDVYGSTTFAEHMYDLGRLAVFQDIPHDGPSLTIEIIGFQNQSSGEFYGLDDISVTFAIPEPGTLSLAAMGLVGLAFFTRRRRR